MAVLEVQGICKTFDKNTVVLRGIDFSLEKGESVAIIGSSGSGKTTLLRCLNFLTVPDEGQIVVNDETLFDDADPNTQKEREIRRKRLHFGLVFQNFNLFPQYTARQNVMLASELIGSGRVRGIIADCGFTSAGDIWRYAIQQKARRGSRSFYRLSDLRCIRKAGYRGDTRSTVQALKNTDIPLLFFHGSEDKFVPTYMSRISYESCASKKRLVIVDGAKHNGSCRTDPIRYRRELENFFNYNETVATDDTLQ